MEEQNNGSTPNLKVEKPKTIVVARQKTIVIKGKGIWPFKRTPNPLVADSTINQWLEMMAKNGQPAQLCKYLSCNGDLVYTFMFNERINID